MKKGTARGKTNQDKRGGKAKRKVRKWAWNVWDYAGEKFVWSFQCSKSRPKFFAQISRQISCNFLRSGQNKIENRGFKAIRANRSKLMKIVSFSAIPFAQIARIRVANRRPSKVRSPDRQTKLEPPFGNRQWQSLGKNMHCARHFISATCLHPSWGAHTHRTPSKGSTSNRLHPIFQLLHPYSIFFELIRIRHYITVTLQ